MTSMRIPASQVPPAVRRRAAQHLESVRETEIGVKARRGRLTADVGTILRPDLSDVAYYEFEVDLGTSGSGFIVVSAGRHDFPVPHWSFDTESVSRRLGAVAEKGGKTLARLYRLDALSYVGEDSSGQMVGQIGRLPMPVEGVPADLEQARGKITSTVAAPASKAPDDANGQDGKHTVTRTGAKPPRIVGSDVPVGHVRGRGVPVRAHEHGAAGRLRPRRSPRDRPA